MFGGTTGGTPFGATATPAAAPTFNFGAPPTTTKSTLNFGTGSLNFGATATGGTAPAFMLGSTTATTSTGLSLGGLSTPASSAGFGFGTGFGTTTATTSAAPTSGFGFGLGSAAPAATTGGFPSFGTTTTLGGATPTFNFGGFGTTQAATTTTAAPSLFSGFGQTQTTPSAGFGGFGTKPLGTAQTTSFPGFGLGSTLGQGFGQPQQQQQQAQQQQQGVPGLDPIYNSVFNCCIFGDAKDEVLSKWNLLQACWGTGKGFYSPNMPPVDYTPQNPLCRFKAIVYSMKPTVESKEGIVALQFNKKEEEIRSQESQLIQSLTAVLGNRPNLAVKVDAIKPASDSSALVFVYVEEKVANGLTRRVPNTELSNYFLQQTPKMQLTQMGAVDMYPYCSPDKAQIQEYLETTPAGIDPRLWKQAQLDNPDCEKYIPVPLLGFNEVRWRYHCQMLETKRHQAFLDGIADEIAVLQRDNETTRLKILEYMHKAAELEHRVLKVLVRQAITRNIGVSLRPEEEVLRSQLETIQSQLNSQEFKGRLSELVSQVKIHKQEASQQDSDSYTMTPSIQDEIKEFLEMEHMGIRSLIDTIQQDMDDLKIIKEDLIQPESE